MTPPLAPSQSGTQEQAARIMASEETIYEGEPAVLPGLGALLLTIITLGFAYLVFYFRRGGIKYRITTQRIVVDSGIFSKKMDQIDLYRVNDFQVDRPFSQRVLGTGNIRITTFDKLNPEVVMHGVKGDVVVLYEKIRAASEAAKQARGVRVIDYE